MKNLPVGAQRSSNKYLIAGISVSAALILSRPILANKVFAATNLYDWTKQTDVDRLAGNYSGAAVSADGSSLILSVTEGGENMGMTSPLYVSHDYGATWDNIADEISDHIQYRWNSVDISYDGQVMVATSDWGSDFVGETTVDGVTVISEDGGDTWTDITPDTDNDLIDIQVSGDGSKVVAVEAGQEDLRVTTNGGDTWSSIAPVADSDEIWNLKSVSLSDNGEVILVGGENGPDPNTNLFISEDSGDTWDDISPRTVGEVWNVEADLSSDGSKIVAATKGYDDGQYGAVDISTDHGHNWDDISPDDAGGATFFKASMSDDGSSIALLDDQDTLDNLYLTNDSGATWSKEQPDTDSSSIAWTAVDLNEDGTKGIVTSQENAFLMANAEKPTVTLSDAVGGKTITLTTPAGTTITCHSAVKESHNGVEDRIYKYPLGLIDFCFSGAETSNQVSLIFVTELKPNEVAVRKYNPNTKKYTTITDAQVERMTFLDGKHALKVTYTITDNGDLDTDSDSGEIADPVGLGVVDVTAPNTGYEQISR